jgi:hypothetical protein
MMVAGIFLATLPAVGQSQMGEEMVVGSCFGRISSYSTPYLEKAAKSYEAGLKSVNEGVVEASITYSTFLRVADPQLDLSDIRQELEKVAVSGRTPALRYKAYLATMVFENPQAFKNSLGVEDPDGSRFFTAVADQISKALLGRKYE